MDRSDIIYLCTPTHTKDEFGQYISSYQKRMVFCEVSSITQSEWFEGSRNGLNPSYRFLMFEPDYNGEKFIEYNGVVYSVYRTYRSKNEIIELYCELNEKGFSV